MSMEKFNKPNREPGWITSSGDINKRVEAYESANDKNRASIQKEKRIDAVSSEIFKTPEQKNFEEYQEINIKISELLKKENHTKEERNEMKELREKAKNL